jgi:molybdopterin-guanine dinucleotide biosynthesis protein A
VSTLGNEPIVGILAGGAGKRMGGVDKAQLHAPGGEQLLPRLLRLCRELSLEALVIGGAAPDGTRALVDDPPGVGPIGGLAALLAHAGSRHAVLLACDLPYLSAPLLERLARTPAPSAATVLAARDPATGKWQPMFARYTSAVVLPPLRAAIEQGVRSPQTFLKTQQVEELPLDDAERAELRDWDRPEDQT